MNLVTVLLVFLSALAISCAFTALIRGVALNARMIDVPNARSSHTRPTPRGGGLAIAASFLLCVSALYFGTDLIPRTLAAALVGSGMIVATVGLIDDRSQLSPWTRLVAHVVAAAWTLWLMPGVQELPILGVSIHLYWVWPILAAMYLVWMVNLYNFMDGIDGIAGIEAIVVSLGGALTWWLASGTHLWFIPVVFAACVGGFLIWNYPPASIFMGDAGSGFVGIMLGSFSLWVAQANPNLFWSWLILLGGFVVDATMTLVRRVARGERFHEAHRSHAYQYASRRHASHEVVSLAFGAIALLWLLPLAVLVSVGKLDGAIGLIVAYAPLILLALKYRAGAPSEQQV